MSYEIFYKIKVFKDNKNNIFVFTLRGANNDFVIGLNGHLRRSRDWYLFYQGSISGLKNYIDKIFNDEYGINITADKTISKEAFLEKIMKSRKKDISEFNNVFKEAFIVDIDGNRIRKADLNDLYMFKEEQYFYENDKKEHLSLLDEDLINWYKELGY
jgi:hypothetical protein